MVTSSKGAMTGGGAFFSKRAEPNEILPTRPQNIKRMIVIFESDSKSLVIPQVIPTVPMPEKTSNTTSENGNPGWTAQIIKSPARAKHKLMKKTQNAFCAASVRILFPKAPTYRDFRMDDTA